MFKTKTVSPKWFEKTNKDYCITCNDHELTDDLEYYIEQNLGNINSFHEFYIAMENSKAIPIYRKIFCKLECWEIVEDINEHLYQRDYLDDDETIENHIDISLLQEFVEQFNKNFDRYKQGTFITYLDLSEQMIEFAKKHIDKKIVDRYLNIKED